MRPKANIYFNVVFALILAACGVSIAPETEPSTTPTLSAITPTLIATDLPTPTPTSVPEILPTPRSILSFNERLLATINIVKEPDEMVFVQGFLWTKTADGHLIQIDPSTNMVTADIKVDTTNDFYHYCQGLGTDGENIWVCSAAGNEDTNDKRIDVVRVDPKSQTIVQTVEVNKTFDQLDLPFALNQIWVLSGSGDKLVGIDVATNELTPAIDLGVRCFQLALVGKSLMATCTQDHVILQIDPEKREITQRLEIQEPRFVIGDENSVWVAQDNALLRLDPKSLTPVAEFSKLGNMGTSGDVFLTEDAIWLREKSGFLYRIDPARNEIVEQIQPDQALSGGSVLIAADSIWVTAYDNNVLFRFSLSP